MKAENKKAIFILITILFLASFFRLFQLGQKSLWLDEAFSINLSSHSLKTIIQGEKNNPPLYHFLLHYWVKIFGKSEASTRLMSAIFSILTIFAIYKLGSELFNSKIAILSSFFLAICPFHIHYSQEARMYSLVVLLTIVSCYFFIKFLKESKKMALFLYFLFSLAAIYTHYFAFFIIAAQNIFIITQKNVYKNQLAYWFLCQFLLFLFYLPWIWSLIQAIEGGKEKYLSHLYLRIPYTLLVFNLGYSGIIINMYAKQHLLQTILNHWFLILAVIVFIIPLFLLGLKTIWQKEHCWKIFILLYFFLPFILALLISIKIPLLAERYFIVTLPAYYLILSAGILSLRTLKTKAIFLSGILFLTAFSLKNYYFNPKFGKGAWRDVAKYIETYSQKNDAITFYPKHIAVAFNYYYKGNLEKFGVSSLAEIKNYKTNPYKRIWFIISHAPKFNYEAVLAKDYNILEKKIFPISNGIHVFLLALSESNTKKSTINHY